MAKFLFTIVPAKLIADAGLKNLPMPSPPMPVPGFDPGPLSSAWDLEERLLGPEAFESGFGAP
jgi:hypothetical protein